MTGIDEAAARPRRGLLEKRQAVLRGALTVFAREGYTRGSIGEIAKEAGVSTRTIYNHFADKDELFRTLIRESASRVRDAHIAQIDRHFAKITDLAADLRAFAREYATAGTAFSEHFALVRQIQAEAGHLPREVLEAWQDAGPRPVNAALAGRFAELGEKGLLEITDPRRAAMHFVLLTGTEVSTRTFLGAVPIPDADIDHIVDAGLEVFLRAYLPKP
ncbi:TetR/AcrR family transcriptional regulator [Yinghuangia sp. YIM S09857]|uniref:TetR/AcrR family transcriptional regulator n=1 Tax=Yinghuangia sp. YIM S09857 TaxID=3436929 RepID=UPI003F52D491